MCSGSGSVFSNVTVFPPEEERVTSNEPPGP
jgi:hypothetical protein